MNRVMPNRERAVREYSAGGTVRARRASWWRGLGAWLLLLAVLGTPAAGAAAPPIRFGIASSPVTLDPRFATDATSSRISRLLHEPLVEFDAGFRPRPALARWEALGPLRWRFFLRPDRRPFAALDRAVVADDVRATYASVLAAETGSPHRGSLAVVAAVEVVDESTVDFVLHRADPSFPGLLTVGVMPREDLAPGARPGRAPRGSGPFEVVDWPDDNRLVLRRRSDGQLLEFVRVREPTVRVLKLLRGEIDLLQGDVPHELIGWAEQRGGVRVERAAGTTVAYLGFNLEDPVVGDIRVRRAIAHAIDRDAIVRHVLGGAARPAESLLQPTHWAGAPGLAPITFDPDRARALLAEAGHGPDDPVRVEYKTSSDPARLRLATIIAHQLAAVGIEVRIRSYDWGTFYGDIRAGRFQLFSLAWVGIKMPDIFRYTVHSASVPPRGANRGRFVDPVVDDLVERAEATVGETERAAHYRALQHRLRETLPFVPLWYEDQVLLARASVHGYRVAPDGGYLGLESVARSP